MVCRPLVVLVALAALAGPGCVGGNDRARPDDGTGSPLSGSVTVLGAASLGAALADAGAAFERLHPRVTVELSSDGSARLAAALIGGAPADVFVGADEATVASVVAAGRAAPPTVIASNGLEIVVAEGNPRRIRGLADLARPDVVAVLCAPAQPCGAYARRAFARAGLPEPAAGGESSVAEVLARVRLGEADAGIVYVTDVRAADDVEGVPLAASEQVVASYPAAVLTDAANPEAAAAFVAFLGADAGQALLRAHGFGPP